MDRSYEFLPNWLRKMEGPNVAMSEPDTIIFQNGLLQWQFSLSTSVKAERLLCSVQHYNGRRWYLPLPSHLNTVRRWCNWHDFSTSLPSPTLFFSCLHPSSNQAGETHLVTCPDKYRHTICRFVKIPILELVYRFIASIYLTTLLEQSTFSSCIPKIPLFSLPHQEKTQMWNIHWRHTAADGG